MSWISCRNETREWSTDFVNNENKESEVEALTGSPLPALFQSKSIFMCKVGLPPHCSCLCTVWFFRSSGGRSSFFWGGGHGISANPVSGTQILLCPFHGSWSLVLIWPQVCGSWPKHEVLVIPFLFPVKTRWPAPSRRVQCWVRMWLWRRVAEENLFPHCEQRSAKALLLGGDDGDDASMAAFSAMWVWRWALRRDIRLNLRPHSSHSDQTLRLFFCTNTDRKQWNLINEPQEPSRNKSSSKSQ